MIVCQVVCLSGSKSEIDKIIIILKYHGADFYVIDFFVYGDVCDVCCRGNDINHPKRP